VLMAYYLCKAAPISFQPTANLLKYCLQSESSYVASKGRTDFWNLHSLYCMHYITVNGASKTEGGLWNEAQHMNGSAQLEGLLTV